MYKNVARQNEGMVSLEDKAYTGGLTWNSVLIKTRL
jgi:hypothetical protein